MAYCFHEEKRTVRRKVNGKRKGWCGVGENATKIASSVVYH